MSSVVFRRVRRLMQVGAGALLCGAAWWAAAQSSALPWAQTPQFLEAEAVLTLPPAESDGLTATLAASVAPGYYVYRQSLALEDDAGERLPLTLPAGVTKEDEFFGVTEVYPGPALPMQFAASDAPLTLHWQACAEAGICYPPQRTPIRVQPATALDGASATPPAALLAAADTAAPATPAPAADGAAALGEDQRAAQQLAEASPLAAIALFFGFGLLLAFTPCTLPMIPIVSTVVVGSQARPRRALVLSGAYVLSMAATYAVVGVIAGLAGANLQASLQSPWLLGSFAALFLVLALSLFGAFELRLPAALADRLASASQHRRGGSVPGALALGLLSALLVGPCMTAPLAGALLYIGERGSAWQGGAALFALGLGMGLPLLLIAVFGARVLPRPGPWMQSVRVAFGFVMTAMAVLMLTRFLSAPLGLLLWGAWGVSVAIGLLAWGQSLAARPGATWALRYGAALALLWSAVLVAGGASGGGSLWQPLAHWQAGAGAATLAKPAYVPVKTVADVQAQIEAAGARGQWTLMDVYADWCVSCHVIERQVFGDPAVAQRLGRMQVLRPDVTANDAADRELMREWGVQGPPTLVLIGPDGQERRAQRVVGEISAQDFLRRLDAAGAP